MSYIGLLDCNNFFVSCERLFRPDLEKKPVLILSSNDGCVISRSNEVKELGIPMGIPHFKVRDELKKQGVTVFSGNITLYRDISDRVMSTLASFELPFEPYSIDEAFFVLEDHQANEVFVTEIRDRVMQWTGIPVSIGVGKSMVIAKYASEQAKKSTGMHIIRPNSAWDEHMRKIHVGELWGVGRSTTATCLKNKLSTAYDIAHHDASRLKAVLGVEGVRLKEALCGKYTPTLDAHEDQKSIMSSRSFGETTTSKSVLFEALSYHIEHVASKLRKRGYAALRMHVHIRPRRHGQYLFRGGYDEVLFDTPKNDTRVLLHYARESLERLYEEGIQYAKAGVVVSGFVPLDVTTGSLFENPDSAEEQSKLMTVIDALNTRLGGAGIHFGNVPSKRSWKTKAAYRSVRYTTNWHSIPRVKIEKDS